MELAQEPVGHLGQKDKFLYKQYFRERIEITLWT